MTLADARSVVTAVLEKTILRMTWLMMGLPILDDAEIL
jgi:hypothetical protein